MEYCLFDAGLVQSLRADRRSAPHFLLGKPIYGAGWDSDLYHMKKVALLLLATIAFCSISFSLPKESSSQGSITYDIRYDNDFNPIVCGTIQNDTEKTITSVEITMHYLDYYEDNGWKQTKVVTVSIAPKTQGSFQLKFDKMAKGKPAFMFTLERFRYSDGTISFVNQTRRL